jgi:FkbM family methyltransferase
MILGHERRPRRILRGLARGCQIIVSPSEHMGYLVGTAEEHLQRIIRDYVRPGDTVFDIGSNIGYVTLSLSMRVGRAGRVSAFEPLPENYELLEKTVALNRLTNVQLFPLAASDSAGTTEIRTTGTNSMASLVWHRDDPCATIQTIRTETIDSLWDAGEVGDPSFVKIDVEGAEAFVVRGMRKLLERSRPIVFIESSELGRHTTWEIFNSLGYECESAISGTKIRDFGQYRHSDFLWVPPEKRHRKK